MQFSKISGTITLISICVCLSCSTIGIKKDSDYICIDHNRHHMTNKSELSQCFSIKEKRIDDYHFYHETRKTKKSEHRKAISVDLRDILEDRIIDIIINKIEILMGKDILKHWHFDQISLPVIFRSFKFHDGTYHYIKSYAAIKKHEFTPKGLVKYLPLEYKMDILKK